MDELESLDDRLLAFADRIPDEHDANSLRSALAIVREGWRGADHYSHLTEAADVLAESATAIAEIVRKYGA